MPSHSPEIPAHVGIIMDGNGRWAEARGLPRREGYRHGVEAARRCVRAADALGISYLTLFSFSSENRLRPPADVAFLMQLLEDYLQSDIEELQRDNIRTRILGRRDGLKPNILKRIAEAEAKTARNTGLQLQVAFNYGSREEIADAARELAQRVARGEVEADSITPEILESALPTAGLPDPDLIIRTSGEMRISNFLLWQAAYAELHFTDILWPDFDDEALAAALQDFNKRERRFGRVAAPAEQRAMDRVE